jgi:hypothetical protein
MTAGSYGGGTFGWPWGGGVGLYVDSHGRLYPQLYGGTPGASLSAGYTRDLEGLLTGTSVSGSLGKGAARFNAGTSGGASGFGIGTPGVGATYGFDPLEMSQDFSRPWATPYVRDSAVAAGIPNRNNVWEYDYPDLTTSPKAPGASARVTKTSTPEQIADFLNKYIFGPAMGPQDQLSPFDRRLQSGLAAVGRPSRPPERFLSGRSQNPIGAGMDDWSANYLRGNAASSAAATNAAEGRAGAASVGNGPISAFASGAPPIPYVQQASQNAPGGLPGLMASLTGGDPSNPMQFEPAPGGLLGLIQEVMRNQALESGNR